MNGRHPPLRAWLRAPLDPGDEQRLWHGIAERRARNRAPRRTAALALGLAGVAAAALIAYRTLPAPPPRAEPSAGPLRFESGAPLAPVEVSTSAAARAVALSDGTRVTLAAGSRLAPRRVTAARTELVLERGRARFEVQPQHGRVFEVASAELRVQVVGTVFTVERSDQGARVEVERGRVRVFAPQLPEGGRLLEAGERFAAAEPLAAVPAADAQASEPASPPGGADATSAADTEQRGSVPPDSAWRAAAARGEYARAYALLGASGFATALRRANDPTTLLALSDAARAAGRPRQAARALGRLLERHPRSAQAALAALTLGRLQLDALDEPRAAARSLRRAIERGLPDALHEDALARLVHACARAADAACANAAAREYRARFAGGRFQANVEAWTAEAARNAGE